MARSFSRIQKNAVALAQGVDPDGMHADHIQPFSKGGSTQVENCQLLPASVNIAKGAQAVSLRRWQESFLDRWKKRTIGSPFLLVAIPGSGKTTAALTAAKQWMEDGINRKLIIVVPTRNLQEQWRDSAVKHGIELQTKEFCGNFKTGYSGIVITYQSLRTNAVNCRAMTSRAGTMLIMDEPHHCADENSWGDDVMEAFELTEEKLLLSGTPWRTDGTRIPYVNYENGYCVPHVRYDYPDALLDGVVRYLAFSYERGLLTDVETDMQRVMDKDISDEEAAEILRPLLDPGGNFVRSQILSAHEKLLEVRQAIPNAGGMIACRDIFHAEAIAKTLEDVTGCKPSVIVSDEDVNTDCAKRFRKSRREWLVTVKQVSEGTDIPRLHVLVYLTTCATAMFFRQIVGRISRVTDRTIAEDAEAYVFLPADPRLIKFSQEIENAQACALATDVVDETDIDISETTDKQRELFEPFYTTAADGVSLRIIGNKQYTAHDGAVLDELARVGGVTLEQAARILLHIRNTPINATPPTVQCETPCREDREKELRVEINKLTSKLAAKTRVHWKEIHKRFSPQQNVMTIEQLKDKLRVVRGWLVDGAIPNA